MKDVTLYTGGGSVPVNRQTRKDLATVQRGGLVRAGRVDVEQVLTGMKVQAAGSVVRQATTQAALIARHATMLAEGATPWEAEQIATVARAGVVSLAGLTQDGIYAIGRI
jgi:hypothetical protein